MRPLEPSGFGLAAEAAVVLHAAERDVRSHRSHPARVRESREAAKAVPGRYKTIWKKRCMQAVRHFGLESDLRRAASPQAAA